MSVVYLGQGEDRETFIRTIFQRLNIQEKVTGKQVLLKPNIVSHEPYPTTTHPKTLETCIRLVLPVAKRVIVADGAAWDAGDSPTIIEKHPLKQTCDKFGVTICDLFVHGTKQVKTPSFKLEVSPIAFECDFIISLPVALFLQRRQDA